MGAGHGEAKRPSARQAERDLTHHGSTPLLESTDSHFTERVGTEGLSTSQVEFDLVPPHTPRDDSIDDSIEDSIYASSYQGGIAHNAETDVNTEVDMNLDTIVIEVPLPNDTTLTECRSDSTERMRPRRNEADSGNRQVEAVSAYPTVASESGGARCKFPATVG